MSTMSLAQKHQNWWSAQNRKTRWLGAISSTRQHFRITTCFFLNYAYTYMWRTTGKKRNSSDEEECYIIRSIENLNVKKTLCSCFHRWLLLLFTWFKRIVQRIHFFFAINKIIWEIKINFSNFECHINREIYYKVSGIFYCRLSNSNHRNAQISFLYSE